MSEGKLYASTYSQNYAIGCTDDLQITCDQQVEIYLGEQWIPGRIHRSGVCSTPSNDGVCSTPSNDGVQGHLQEPGGYYVFLGEDDDGVVTASSEESFPASDSPAWTMSRKEAQQRRHNRLAKGDYFVADVDGTICGLCIGMRVRLRE